ncbi:LytR/AlgR family response regulator transcription factor [Antarcticibacterium arcticum]|uniref:LytR/AlgR family response regulator transcription factor n=1 Tax=Antarcticibacterium arcticum TaxID=2585771 RepID=UPI001F0D6DF3|nr:LytTR family DNA-binding domain-containing protein [Antarcticibacterium arcticum]
MNSYGKTAVFIVSPIVVHLLIFPFVAVAFSMLFYEGRYDLYKFYSYSLSHDLYKVVMVYATFVVGYKYFLKHTRDIYIGVSKPPLDTIVVNNGKENVVVKVEDITHITSDSPYITFHLKDIKYLHSETLKSICDKLDKNVFVRVHKSTVVNITKVRSFKSRLNGDYDLQLEDRELVRLSRTYAPDFKKRFSINHRVNL